MGKINQKVIKAKIAINKVNMLAVLSHVQLFVTLWISLQEYDSGLPFPLQGTFPTQRLNPCLLYLLHHRRNICLKPPRKPYMLATDWLKQMCGQEGESNFSLNGEDLLEELTFGLRPARCGVKGAAARWGVKGAPGKGLRCVQTTERRLMWLKWNEQGDYTWCGKWGFIASVIRSQLLLYHWFYST